jgi:hypothetical protein
MMMMIFMLIIHEHQRIYYALNQISLVSAEKYGHKEENQQVTCMSLMIRDAADVTMYVSVRSHH